MTEDQIKSMSEEKYKQEIKINVHNSAFEYLLAEQKEHSKIEDIQYDKLEVQPYLCSPLFSRKEQSTLFRLRSRTIAGIRNDFRGMYMDSILCPVCPIDTHIDTIPNLVNCQTLQDHIKSRGLSTSKLKYKNPAYGRH